jgi:hypothetical protein
MEFLCIQHEHSQVLLKNNVSSIWILKILLNINIFHINHVTKKFDQQQTQQIHLFEISCQSKS